MSDYIYFVSYAHERGFGNIEITQNVEMSEFQHIRGVEEIIKNKSEIKSPIVISYQLLRAEGTDE